MNEIRKKQEEFQKVVGFPVDSKKEDDLLQMSETYIFKAIEELIELRKEFPSIMNPWSKDQRMSDRQRILEEFSDVQLFLINFANIWNLTDEEIVENLKFVQRRNFVSLKRKKLEKFNDSILGTPGYTIGVGQGNLYPKYIFIGQNPGEGIHNGYKVWSDENDGSSKVLLPILDKLQIRQDSYFTNLVKCTTPGNEQPNLEMKSFWLPKLLEEIRILSIDNPDIKIIPMGKYVSDSFSRTEYHNSIPHPAFVLRGGMTYEQYEKEVENAIK